MRETVRSMRAYFVLAGLAGLLLGLRDASAVSKLSGLGLPASWVAVLWFSVATRLVLGAGYVAAGARLPAELPRGAGWIRTMLLSWIVVLVIDAALVAGVIGMELGQGEVTQSVIGLAITAYLLANLRRLADEAMAGLPPPARVA